MIDEICGPVKSSSSPQQCLVRNTERIDFQNTEDMYNEFKVIYINCQLWATKEDHHGVSDQLGAINLLNDLISHRSHREHSLVKNLEILHVVFAFIVSLETHRVQQEAQRCWHHFKDGALAFGLMFAPVGSLAVLTTVLGELAVGTLAQSDVGDKAVGVTRIFAGSRSWIVLFEAP